MKKIIKKLGITFCIILLFFLLIIFNRKHIINTEYGDSFTVITSLLDEEDFLKVAEAWRETFCEDLRYK